MNSKTLHNSVAKPPRVVRGVDTIPVKKEVCKHNTIRVVLTRKRRPPVTTVLTFDADKKILGDKHEEDCC